MPSATNQHVDLSKLPESFNVVGVVAALEKATGLGQIVVSGFHRHP